MRRETSQILFFLAFAAATAALSRLWDLVSGEGKAPNKGVEDECLTGSVGLIVTSAKVGMTVFLAYVWSDQRIIKLGSI